MAAAQITPTFWNNMHSNIRVYRLNKVTQNDWVILKEPGVFVNGIYNYAGTADTFTFGTGTIYNSGTAYTSSTTSIAVASVPASRVGCPFYIQTTSGEVIKVVTDSAPAATAATWTLERAQLGTTASATGLANTNTFYIKNVLTLTGAGTGYTEILATPMPSEGKAQVFYTT